jgi:uncharacterized membrane protein YfcA
MSVTLAGMGADDALIGLAGLGAGVVNGIAGGGSLLAFPVLIGVGYSALQANVTTTVGIWAGYLGGIAGFRRELADQRARVRAIAPVAMGGGLIGAVLLLVTPATLFRDLAPLLILAACALFAAQPWLAARARARAHPGAAPGSAVPRLALVGTFLAAIYGGYFGAGLGVILLAVLGLTLEDTLSRINGLRGVLSLLVNSIAVVVFATTAHVAWHAAGILAGTSLVGGYLGARLSLRLEPTVLRAVVIVFGLVSAIKLLVG